MGLLRVLTALLKMLCAFVLLASCQTERNACNARLVDTKAILGRMLALRALHTQTPLSLVRSASQTAHVWLAMLEWPRVVLPVRLVNTKLLQAKRVSAALTTRQLLLLAQHPCQIVSAMLVLLALLEGLVLRVRLAIFRLAERTHNANNATPVDTATQLHCNISFVLCDMHKRSFLPRWFCNAAALSIPNVERTWQCIDFAMLLRPWLHSSHKRQCLLSLHRWQIQKRLRACCLCAVSCSIYITTRQFVNKPMHLFTWLCW